MTSAAQTTSIGSFAIEAPLPLDDPRLAGLPSFLVRDDQRRRGIAYAASVANLDQAGRERVRSRMDWRARVATPGITPVLETGLAGSAAFIVEAEPRGERLDQHLARVQRLTPFDATAIAVRTASALADAQRAHGQLSSSLLWIDRSSTTLSGFAFDEPLPGTDAIDLAGLVFEMLSGHRFDADAFQGLPAVRVEQIREALPGISASLANVVSDGTRGVYPTVADLVAALESARAESIVLLADAANQSLSLKDAAGANVFLDAARTYDPCHPAIMTAEARLAASDKTAARPPIDPVAPAQVPAFDHGYEPGSEQALFLERLRASVPDATQGQSRKPIPWAAVVAGAVGVFAILTIIVVIFAYTR